MEDQSRRDALKKGAAGAAILWAAPAVTGVTRAYGAVGTPPPGGRCDCTASGFGLHVTGNVLGTDVSVGPLSNIVTVGSPGELVYAAVLPTTTNENPGICSARSAVTDLQINSQGLVVQASALEARISAPCDPCGGTASSEITRLVVNGDVLIADAAAGVIATSTPNNVLLDALGIRVVVNEQVCEGNTGVVRALHITANLPAIPVSLDVIVAEARAGNTACGCPLTQP